MPSNILSTPWVPTLHKHTCGSYTPYDEVVDENAEPNPIEHAQWARRNLESELEKAPDGADALWEVVLALWRLKLFEETGGPDETWQKLVSAWLHRHKDLCAHLKIAPLKVVVDYQDALRVMECLIPGMIPNLKEPSLAPEPVPVPDPQSTPNPTSKKVPNRRRKTAIAPSVIRSDLGDDVQMSDSAVSSVAPSTRKDMEQARSDLSRNTSETRQNKSDAGKTGSKRAFQESPSHVAKSSKRLRVPPQKSKTTPGLNLGAHTFPEDSVVSTDLVPKLKGKVCTFCKGARKRKCVPTWHRMGKFAGIRCEYCFRSKKGCSFKKEDWGIDTWPHLEITSDSATRRAREAKAKRNKRKGLLLDSEEEVPESSNADQGGRPNRRRVIMRDVYIRTPPPKFKLASKPTIDSSSAATPTLRGTTRSIFLEDILPFEALAFDPNTTQFALKVNAVELRTIAIRERGQAQALLNDIQNRAVIIDELARQLSDAATDDEEDDMEDGEREDIEESNSGGGTDNQEMGSDDERGEEKDLNGERE